MTREAAPLFMRVVGNTLSPTSSMDADMLAELPKGVDLEIQVKHRKRSLPQLRAYWAGLHEFVKATEAFPSAEYAHDAIKLHLGFVKRLARIDGGVSLIPDSAAFDAMDNLEFKSFLDRAQRLVLEAYGVDIMANTEARFKGNPLASG